MNGQYRTFLFRFEGETLVVGSAEPQIGDLKTYPQNRPAPDNEEEAVRLARGRIDLDFDELTRLELQNQ